MWASCIDQLRSQIPDDEIDTWLLPMHTIVNDQTLKLLAPNRYVLNHVRQNLFHHIESAILSLDAGVDRVQCEIGSHASEASPAELQSMQQTSSPRSQTASPTLSFASEFYETSATNHGVNSHGVNSHGVNIEPHTGGRINRGYTFDNHVEGNSNQLARAAAQQVGEHPGKSYNPLFIYGGVGLGKTHLMQAAGNLILNRSPQAKVVYIRSELFVNDMVKALKNNTMNEFKRYYRSLDALLIDDIQFFARKTQSQEEFFHTFNALLEGQRQIIITSDRIPKAMTDVEERLVSRFGSGLTVSIDPPELETRVAILGKKALEKNVDLPEEVAFFVANAVKSNVRELEGALHRIVASAGFTGRDIDIDLAREALRDLMVYRESRINIDSIQQTVAEYYKIRVADLLSKKRSRDIARPRQMAMALAKEYTNHSLPQIGDRFGGRDHTTVLHACRKIEELLHNDAKVQEDQRNLLRLLGA
ncbi:MAG: chromosomal replication initiator protein DnaA [Gammaproteobacteria bacterium]|nr:chromosomal replication initiator protein DnaA [Gammaproteobacteria bacterium]